MKGNDLLDKLELIDPAYIEAADKKHTKINFLKWGSIAACICLLISAVIIVPKFISGDKNNPNRSQIDTASKLNENEGKQTPNILPDSNPGGSKNAEGSVDAEGPWEPWTATFNEVVSATDAARKYVPGYFTETLSEEDIATLEPAKKWGYMEYSGTAGFDGTGNLIEVLMDITTNIPEQPVHLNISRDASPRYFETAGVPVLSTSDYIDYTVYQWNMPDGNVLLQADAEINQYHFCFTMKTAQCLVEEAKNDFQMILECFTYWPEGKPDLSVIVAENIPEFINTELTLVEAKSDSDFGKFMPKEVPSGFKNESIQRYKDQNNDYLFGLWTKGYDELRWKIAAYSEQDSNRLTGIEETRNYDLSLYPIPRADSVPDELRSIVDNPIFDIEELTIDAIYARAYKSGENGDSKGWRMNFSVRYGDFVVYINSKGVEPEWIYEQLMSLNEN